MILLNPTVIFPLKKSFVTITDRIIPRSGVSGSKKFIPKSLKIFGGSW